jgi:hypothetical protein
MKRRVIFTKWIDPFEPDKEVEPDSLPYKDSYERMEEEQKKPGANAGPMLVGPMGVIPLNEHNRPSKVFNFWMGHTNFNIGQEEINLIEHCPGVETLEIYTRYRFRFSIGKAFEEKQVIQAIKKRLYRKRKQKKKQDSISSIKKFLSLNYKCWAIFVLDDGTLDYRTGDTRDSVQEKINNYPKKANRILTSWEINNETEQNNKKNGNGCGIQTSIIR